MKRNKILPGKSDEIIIKMGNIFQVYFWPFSPSVNSQQHVCFHKQWRRHSYDYMLDSPSFCYHCRILVQANKINWCLWFMWKLGKSNFISCSYEEQKRTNMPRTLQDSQSLLLQGAEAPCIWIKHLTHFQNALCEWLQEALHGFRIPPLGCSGFWSKGLNTWF